MISGIGTDIVAIERFQRFLDEGNSALLQRVFTEQERAYCSARKNSAASYAARFAAKEAISKAFSTGIGAELGWTSMSIYHGPRHEPHVRLDEKGLALLAHVGGTRVLLSIAHSDTVAIAFAAIVRCDDADP